MAYFGEKNRKDNCSTAYQQKDYAGRWLTNVYMHSIGYNRKKINEEMYCKGDDIYLLDNQEILTESRTNVRLWDCCLLPNKNPNQWIRGNKGESDLIITWGTHTHRSWIGNVCIGGDVRTSPKKKRGSINAYNAEMIYDVPWTAIKHIIKISIINDNRMKIDIWSYTNKTISAWKITDIPTTTHYVDVPISKKLLEHFTKESQLTDIIAI